MFEMVKDPGMDFRPGSCFSKTEVDLMMRSGYFAMQTVLVHEGRKYMVCPRVSEGRILNSQALVELVE